MYNLPFPESPVVPECRPRIFLSGNAYRSKKFYEHMLQRGGMLHHWVKRKLQLHNETAESLGCKTEDQTAVNA